MKIYVLQYKSRGISYCLFTYFKNYIVSITNDWIGLLLLIMWRKKNILMVYSGITDFTCFISYE